MNVSHTCQYSLVIYSLESSAVTARLSSLNSMFILRIPLIEFDFCQTSSRLAFFYRRLIEWPETIESLSSSLPNLGPLFPPEAAYWSDVAYSCYFLFSKAMPAASSVASSSSSNMASVFFLFARALAGHSGRLMCCPGSCPSMDK